MNPDTPMKPGDAQMAVRNKRTAWILASIALVFGFGFVLHYWLFR